MRKQINWQTSYPTERGNYLVTVQYNDIRAVVTDNITFAHDGKPIWCNWNGAVVAWCKLSDVLPYNLDERIKKCERMLIGNGIEYDEACAIMQAIGFELLNKDIYED